MRMEVPLNRYALEMVKPDKCIRRSHMYNNEADICDECFLCIGNFCVYDTVEVEYASGFYETDSDKKRKNYYEQFCCPKCGEIIGQDSYYIIDWNNDIQCKHCGSEYVALESNFEKKILTLAKRVEYSD